ncbi:MAG TPA: hypothetical protein VFC10_07470 [Terriglobia bacterium]|jgi:predicted  nucleic acid-binding Zn-ribbon protein|nr:hypothetical protein [Terracidiphilus sp.]HZT69573.1 hypothetical protein [Terriglobia bacterium]
MADNILQLALEIVANPSQAMQAIEDFRAQAKAATADVQTANQAAEQGAAAAAGAMEQVAAAQQEVNLTAEAMRRTIAASLQMQGATAEEAAEVYRQLGINATQAAAEIKAAFGDASSTAQAASAEAQAATGGIRQSMNELFLFRRALSATLGLAALGFYITEWGRVAEAIKDAALALGGYDEEMRAVEEDARKASEAALTSFGELDAATRLRLSLIADSDQRSKETLQLEIQRTEQQLRDLRSQIDSVNRLKQAKEDLHALEVRMSSEAVSGIAGSPDELARQAELIKEISGLESQLGDKVTKDLGKSIASLQDDLDKGNKALVNYQVQLNELNEKPQKAAASIDKAAQAQERWANAIATARVHLPPYIAEIDRLREAIAQQESGVAGTLQILKEYEKTVREMAETPRQLGFSIPEGGAPISTQIQQVHQLTEAEREQLPTEREISLAVQELTREYPNLTNAERQEWAMVMLTSQAYRQHIDQIGHADDAHKKFIASLHSLTGVWGVLATLGNSTYERLAQEAQNWANTSVTAHQLVIGAMTAEVAMMGIAAATGEQAYKLMLRQLAEYLERKAEVKAAEQVAEALSSWPNAAAMAAHFAAAAAWMALGGAAAAAASAVGYGSTIGHSSGTKAATKAQTSATAATATTTPPALAAGAASAQAAQQNTEHTIQVIFQGPVYGGRAATQEIINNINAAVKYNRQQLFASHNPTGGSL